MYFPETLKKSRPMNFSKSTEGIFDIYLQSNSVEDFPNLQGQLKHIKHMNNL